MLLSPMSEAHAALTATSTAARILIGLGLSELAGIIHLGGPERLSRFDLMRRAAIPLGIDPSLIRPVERDRVPSAEPRARRHVAGHVKIEQAVSRFCSLAVGCRGCFEPASSSLLVVISSAIVIHGGIGNRRFYSDSQAVLQIPP